MGKPWRKCEMSSVFVTAVLALILKLAAPRFVLLQGVCVAEG